MVLTPQNLVRHELTGLKIEIISSSDPKKIGIKGILIRESKNLLIILTSKGESKIPKKECVFRFTLENAKVDVSGERLIGRPEDRIKK